MRLIDADKLPLNKIDDANYGSNFIRIAPTVEAILKADYENRLKTDMVAILEETQAQIDDLWEATWHSDYRGGFKDGCIESNNIIQQKINALKGEENVDKT